MFKKKIILAGLLALASPGALFAADEAPATPAPTSKPDDTAGKAAAPTSPHTVTGNVAIASQYIFRGLTQTNERPAIQGGFDYAHASGFYVGVWGSNISWFSDANPGNSASIELDTYVGYKGSLPADFTYDVGFLRYNYPGSYPALNPGVVKPNTNEFYGAIGWKFLNFKYSHSIDDTFGVADSKNTYYADLSASYELPQKWTVGAHVGRQKYKGSAFPGISNDSLFSYTDWKLSVNKELYGFNLGVAYTDTNANPLGYTILGKNIGRNQFVFSVQKTF